ncbi:[citrate (pro-3S)-lyase] ligase [Lentilactobacillus farraginis]|uniref:[Citrate [pro-3S]-lyase] ligase n=1 Tax=Lentilactobacillus farraginis DSM 18382 = JCM 14108 TaxID=1423743 RepID=X0PHI6_9LACO|nr:[citrate (pro-3S)-lyase] ligase [Lentilactobacillus farraginis]KRM12214.1 [citrate (pro-3S)-lyase] ligase [Lentilactobacillus farraginis DSM 18382 = JCM 14108]GAF36492.1 [citrate [pro-3S]-lyase] ligase [Lentilactobacillus farraginis DSM 18382 = JCM 14108]
MYESIEQLNLNDPRKRQQWENFLKSLGISNFSDKEINGIDLTLGMYDGNELVGTGSAAGNVLKFIGVCNKGVTQGARFNRIISELTSRLYQNQIFHILVFTKKKYSQSFQHLGFTELASTDSAAFLETGSPNITDYLDELPKVVDQEHQSIAGIVMNANPFTLGHRYLIERAASENDWVYVFVVNTDASLFSTDERVALVKQGTADLKNVMVVSGGDYMVSYATFPAYFLPDSVTNIAYQTTMDARIFRDRIAPALHIGTRYIGTEPYSNTTSQYNKALLRELPPKVKVREIKRLKTAAGQYITATQVRKIIQEGDVTRIKELLPKTTYQFIEDHLDMLELRIKKGMNIDGN